MQAVAVCRHRHSADEFAFCAEEEGGSRCARLAPRARSIAISSLRFRRFPRKAENLLNRTPDEMSGSRMQAPDSTQRRPGWTPQVSRSAQRRARNGEGRGTGAAGRRRAPPGTREYSVLPRVSRAETRNLALAPSPISFRRALAQQQHRDVLALHSAPQEQASCRVGYVGEKAPIESVLSEAAVPTKPAGAAFVCARGNCPDAYGVSRERESAL